MIGTATGSRPVSITGLGCKVPDRVVTNDELAKFVDTSDEWIVERTGIRERRMADDADALSDVALPACRDALAQAGLEGKDLDLLIVATVTPDMAFPSTAAILADQLGATSAAAYDLSAGCTGFVYALAQGYAMVAGGLAARTLVVGGDLLSRILDLGRSRDARPLRRRGGCRGARGGARPGFHRLRAGRRRRRGSEPLGYPAAAPACSTNP